VFTSLDLVTVSHEIIPWCILTTSLVPGKRARGKAVKNEALLSTLHSDKASG